MHVFLSNIELRQNEWRNRCRYWIDDDRGWTDDWKGKQKQDSPSGKQSPVIKTGREPVRAVTPDREIGKEGSGQAWKVKAFDY